MLPNGKLFATRVAKLQAERFVTLTGFRVIQYTAGPQYASRRPGRYPCPGRN